MFEYVQFGFENCRDCSRKLYFLKQQLSLRRVILKKRKNSMLYWCHSCSKITLPNATMKCQYCASDAIEEVQEQNNPSQYIPPSVQVPHPEPALAQTQQNTVQSEDGLAQLFSLLRPQRVIIRTFVPEPVFTFFRIVHMPEEEHKSVDEEKMKQLQRVENLQHDCAICQEKEGSGLKLECKHEFHQSCIKPWFSNSNTCPCCRAVV